jgi:four helix bundle protein
MNYGNIILDKSFYFAIEIVKATKNIQKDQREFILSKQLLKSGTSIGANVCEAHNAESKKDFIHKMGIAQKECDETKYWLELLSKTQYLSSEMFETLHNPASELLKILRSIIISSKKNLNNS